MKIREYHSLYENLWEKKYNFAYVELTLLYWSSVVYKFYRFAAPLGVELLFNSFHRMEFYFGDYAHFGTEMIDNLFSQGIRRCGSSYFDKDLIGEDFIITDFYDVVLHLGKFSE